MSDYGDDDRMDLDETTTNNDVSFSASAKGKRSAANLPVEAEDSLPWYALTTYSPPLHKLTIAI